MLAIRLCTLRYVVSNGFSSLRHACCPLTVSVRDKRLEANRVIFSVRWPVIEAQCPLLSAGSGDDPDPMMTQAASVRSQDKVGTMSV